jgi:predicted nucleic acid-binding protein
MMRRVVADASAIAEYLFRTPRGLALRPTLESSDQEIHIPALCDVELTAVVRRGLLRRSLDDVRSTEVLADYQDLPLTRHGHAALLHRVLELRQNFSAYDGIYVALAERLDATLVTADQALATAVARHLNIEIIGQS